MPPMIEAKYGVPMRKQGIDYVHVAAAVLPVAVNDRQHRSSFPLGPPALGAELETVRSLKRSFTVLQCDGSRSFSFESSPEPRRRSMTPLAKSGPKKITMTNPRPRASGSLPNTL